MSNKQLPEKEEEVSRGSVNRRTFLSFLVFGAANAAAYMGWRFLGKQPDDKGILKPLRSVLYSNERINEKFYSNDHLIKQFPKSKIDPKTRVNGWVGLEKEVNPEWKLNVTKHPETLTGKSDLELTLDEIKQLPKLDLIYDFKCIEGWSQISQWSGVPFIEFMKKYKLGTKNGEAYDPEHPEYLYKYAALVTPDKKYYVGMDMKSMMHPQTILCYELNEKPLNTLHGAPLRLITPIKYGVKNLKTIGSIYFIDNRPPDYWYERGYDYDCAL